MKLSVDTYVVVKRFGEEKAFRMIKDAGFECIDYSFYWLDDDMKETMFGDDYLKHAIKTRKLLDEIGLVCNQAHAPFDFKPKNGDIMDISNEKYASIIKSIEIASILGAENIVVHGLYPIDDKSILETNYKYYKSFEPYLEKFGIHLAIENLFGEPYDNVKKKYTNNRFDRPELMKEILNKLDSDRFVCCLDIGHAAITDIEPQDYVRGMNNNTLKALHIHDNDYEQDRHMLPYTGKINWYEVAKSLKEIGYDGEFTFEITSYLNGFDDEMLFDALKFAEKTGRYIINNMEV